MANDTIKITGLKELHDALGELKKGTERSVLTRVAKKALEPMLQRARELVPVDEGRLRDSIQMSSSGLTRGARQEDRDMPKRGVRMYVGTASRNAVPREFGTWRTAPEPYMRPAWESTKDATLNSVASDLKTEIERTAARAAKRKTRS